MRGGLVLGAQLHEDRHERSGEAGGNEDVEEELGQDDAALEQARPVLVGDPQGVGEALLERLGMRREAFFENALRFNVASNLLRSQIRMVKSAIDEGKNG